ncbi:MAG: hypothetical protein QXY83_04635 [Thermosphaera sp.]
MNKNEGRFHTILGRNYDEVYKLIRDHPGNEIQKKLDLELKGEQGVLRDEEERENVVGQQAARVQGDDHRHLP